MSDEERAKLQRAVDALNAVLSQLRATHGRTLSVRPYANYNTEDGYAAVKVEITTGIEMFE